ncbi:hypothetical protein CERSUDRAFT_136845 [Gelatoporia subvermispora B]|uniref:Uncharacterized protein n=1 Tax=Ceriporiopsis subvermispora (strain B) TaxID=914234 RepID=M2RHF9_CERS8|nr:hypothetical protein CERSUDRAFT_136845 [Gelatoporia subvermispora B]
MPDSPSQPQEEPAKVFIYGSQPGKLDPSQLDRLLRVPGSRLSFASFDPLTAFTRDASHGRSDDTYRPKRIVIETLPGPAGESFWRFVPRARTEEGVEDEGRWPRVVDICGELIRCSQEQWEIYKIDPEYDCLVRAPPNLTVITRKKGKERAAFVDPANPDSAQNTLKRGPPSPVDERQPETLHKRFRKVVNISGSLSDDDHSGLPHAVESDDEADEVEKLVGESFSRASSAGPNSDRPPSRQPSRSRSRPPSRGRSTGPSERLRQFKQEAEQRRRRRRMQESSKNAADYEPSDQEMIDLTEKQEQGEPLFPETHANDIPRSHHTKRKATSPSSQGILQPDGLENIPDSPSNGHAARAHKRQRQHSPPLSARITKKKRQDLKERRAAHYKARTDVWNEVLHRQLFDEVMATVPEEPTEYATSSNGSSRGSQPSSENARGAELDEEASRRADIEASRRKLAELEKDRPLWEQAAREREARQQVEEEAFGARREAGRRRTEAEQRRRDAERAEAARQAQAEKDRVNRERQKEQRRRQHERWAYGPWTTQRALERYKVLCESFDAVRPTPADPVTFEIVPWPVLRAPAQLTVEDVHWGAVESFFKAVRVHMRSQDYKVFVEKSHRRFHPDRWRARGLLKSITDDELRGCLEVAANTVAQALTPLWREVKGG